MRTKWMEVKGKTGEALVEARDKRRSAIPKSRIVTNSQIQNFCHEGPCVAINNELHPLRVSRVLSCHFIPRTIVVYD